MGHIQDLVRSAMGFDKERGDELSVVNVRFDHADDTGEGVSAASPFSFDKNDIMRVAELGVLLVVATLLIFFVARPMMKAGVGGGSNLPALRGAGGGVTSLSAEGLSGGYESGGSGGLSLPSPSQMDQKVDIAKIEGQVSGSSVRRIAEFVEKHPDESVSLLRNWLHES